jgi:hypothetical protein
MEQVYNPVYSGKGSMLDTRRHLLKNGMTPQFADLLSTRYIKSIEDKNKYHIAQIMDLFDCEKDSFKALKAVIDTDLQNTLLNYETLGTYSNQINTIYQYQKM